MLFGTDDKCFLGVVAHSQFHQTVVLVVSLEVNASSESDHFSNVLADECLLLDVFIGKNIIAHAFLEHESEGSHRLLLVSLVDLVLCGRHVIKSEVQTLLRVDVEAAVNGDELLCVFHIFSHDGEDESLLVS
jgi:hypothetical protein